MTTRTIIRVYCPGCRCDVLTEVRHVGNARRCSCPWCDHKLRASREKTT